MRWMLVTPTVLSIVALLGCGGSSAVSGSSDEATVRDRIEFFFKTMAEGDSEGTCEVMHPEERSKMEQDTDMSCAELFDGMWDSMGEYGHDDFSELTIDSVEVNGSNATANVSGVGDNEGPVEAEKIDGKWYVSRGSQNYGG